MAMLLASVCTVRFKVKPEAAAAAASEEKLVMIPHCEV